MLTTEEFWSHVEVSSPESCWIWVGRVNDHGYGRLNWRGKPSRAHRVSYELQHGSIDPLLSVCHKCDNTSCVNPYHLFQGTHLENMRDCQAKGRRKCKITSDQVNYIIQHPEKLNRELGEELGISHSTVGRIRRGRNRNPEERSPQPKRNVKLSDDQVKIIRSSLDRSCDLASRFKVSPQAISKIRKGKMRKSVE